VGCPKVQQQRGNKEKPKRLYASQKENVGGRWGRPLVFGKDNCGGGQLAKKGGEKGQRQNKIQRRYWENSLPGGGIALFIGGIKN